MLFVQSPTRWVPRNRRIVEISSLKGTIVGRYKFCHRHLPRKSAAEESVSPRTYRTGQ